MFVANKMKKLYKAKVAVLAQRYRTGLLMYADRIGYARWRTNPLGSLNGTKSDYDRRFTQASDTPNEHVEKLENEMRQSIPSDFLKDVAYNVQISNKKSFPDYSHGRVLYTVLSGYLSKKGGGGEQFTIYETGTAKGFSCLCLAKAMSDTRSAGKIITFDIIPHNVEMYWNCVSDHLRGPIKRSELLEKWSHLLNDYILFVEGDTKLTMNKLHASRIHFAFLDGGHTYSDVCFEFECTEKRQKKGDIVIVDDYNDVDFPGIVQAVDEMGAKYNYSIKVTPLTGNRRMAICEKY